MKATLSILALAFGAASAVDFTPIENATGSYTSFLQLVNETNAAPLFNNGPITIFGPNDSGFSIIDSLLEGYTVQEKVDILLDHVVPGQKITSAMIVEKVCMEVGTVGGLQLQLKYEPSTSTIRVNDIPVSEFNIDSDFGTFHGMDGILLEGLLGAFEPCPKPPILDPIVTKGGYDTLVDFIIESNSVATLTALAPMTIFGPKDTAFAAISNVTDDLSTEALQEVLLNHIVLGEIIEVNTIISAGCIERDTAGGLKVSLLYDGDVLSINGMVISDFNIYGDFGVFQGIDSVLVEGLQGDFVECPPFAADFSPIRNRGIYLGLMNAIANSGADKEISANAPVTIFGPNDIAIGAVNDRINSYTQEQFKEMALRHTVLGGAISISEIVQAVCFERVTAAGTKIAVRYNKTSDQVDVNGIFVNDFGIQGDYGIMHGMQGVLFDDGVGYVECPTPSFVDQIVEEGTYTALVTFLATSNLLQQEFARAGQVTVFGPNDPAFEAVAGDLQGAGETEIVTTLGGHVVQKVYTAEDLIDLGCVVLRTVVGSTIRVMYLKDENVVMVNDAKVILPNIQDDVSIFHGIDKMIDSGETFECPQTPEPTRAPSPPVAPQPAPSSAPRTGLLVAAAASVAAFAL